MEDCKMTMLTGTIARECVVFALVAGCQTVSLNLAVSSRRYSRFLSTFRLQQLCSICNDGLRDAFQCIAQPNTTLLDCMLYLLSRHFTKLCNIVYPWESASEIQFIKEKRGNAT